MLWNRLRKLEAGFRSLTESIETTSPAGRILMQFLATFAV